MITGKEYLKKHINETNIPEEYYENEIGEMMDWYADDYHQEQVKKLTIADVSQQRELLIAFREWMFLKHEGENTSNKLIDEYLNCN